MLSYCSDHKSKPPHVLDTQMAAAANAHTERASTMNHYKAKGGDHAA